MQNVLKKNWIKENLSKVIICLVFVFVVLMEIGVSNKPVLAANTYYNYTMGVKDQWGPELTVNSTGTITLGALTETSGCLYLEYAYGADSSFTKKTLFTVDGDNPVKTFSLSLYSLQPYTVYKLYFTGVDWNNYSANSIIYYVSLSQLNGTLYFQKIQDKFGEGYLVPSLTITSDGFVLLENSSDVTGSLCIEYYNGSDSGFTKKTIFSVDGEYIDQRFSLLSYGLKTGTGYKVYFSGVTYFGVTFSTDVYLVSISQFINLPETPTKEGYTFKGWYYDAEFTRPYVQGTPIFEDTTLFAKFEINRYTVTYILNGSTYKIDTVDWNTAAQNYSLTQEGYTFSGWHTDSACTVDYNFDSTVKSNLTLYAKNIINTYTVTFDANGGTITGGNATQTVEYGKSATAPVVSRTGYTFAGWDKTFNNITANLTVTAQWTINSYTVTFDANGGTITDGNATQTVEYGKSATAPTVSREGYNFTGWDKEFNNITGNLMVNAQWEIITFTVTFYVDGVVYDIITVDYGTMFFENDSVQEIMKTLSAVYSDTEKTTLFAPATALNEDMTLYADVNASLRDWLDFALWMQKNWIWVTVCVGVLIAVIVIVLIKVKRG